MAKEMEKRGVFIAFEKVTIFYFFGNLVFKIRLS